jgi:5-methylcytosine-specific restriction protein B
MPCPIPTDDSIYRKLQEDLTRDAPDVENTAWGHKYFHMVCPTKIDDYHVANFQRFHLIKLLQLPPEGEGRYICAGRFAAQARDLNIPINSLSTLLNQLHGRPYSYWRINTNGENGRENLWKHMQQENIIAIGWEKLGDLSWLEYRQESKTKLRAY